MFLKPFYMLPSLILTWQDSQTQFKVSPDSEEIKEQAQDHIAHQ